MVEEVNERSVLPVDLFMVRVSPILRDPDTEGHLVGMRTSHMGLTCTCPPPPLGAWPHPQRRFLARCLRSESMGLAYGNGAPPVRPTAFGAEARMGNER